jgi:hypothetical protein
MPPWFRWGTLFEWEKRPSSTVIQALSDYYRVPCDLLGSVVADQPSGDSGFFRFGPRAVCFGRSATGVSARVEDSALHDVLKSPRETSAEVRLPFDPDAVIDNLRRERYLESVVGGREGILKKKWFADAYYFVRRLLPVPIRRHLQRAYFSDWKSRPFPSWPVDFTVDNQHEELLRFSLEAQGVQRVPFIWFWPDGAPNCLIMTHDVETAAGRDFTSKLMDLDQSYGIRASFQVIPEQRYTVPEEYVAEIHRRGFEFNVHDLNHDGRLYQERDEFLRRAKKINEYVRHYHARGFRAGAMYRNLDWYDSFEFSYDMSVPSVAHLEPKRGGCCTVMPYFVGKILEIPLTAAQDYSLFHILNDYSIDLWKRQLDLIRQKNGLMSFITHPDYLIESRPRKVYEALLDYLRQLVTQDKIWAPLPRDVDDWWRARSQMQLVRNGEYWEIEGAEKERARIAYATLDGDRLRYEVSASTPVRA